MFADNAGFNPRRALLYTLLYEHPLKCKCNVINVIKMLLYALPYFASNKEKSLITLKLYLPTN